MVSLLWLCALYTIDHTLRNAPEVEHPVVLSVACIQQPLRVFALVSAETLRTGRRVARDGRPIRNVHQVFDVIESGEVPWSGEEPSYEVGHG